MPARRNVRTRVVESTEMSNPDERQKKFVTLIVLELVALVLILLFLR